MRITRPFVLLALVALLSPPAEASRTSVWESNPPAAVDLTKGGPASALSSLAPADDVDHVAAELPAFDLGDVDLVEREIEHEERFDLGPLTLVDLNLLRGPPPSYPETRVGGFELLPPFRIGASPTPSLWGRQACGSISCRLVSDSPEDPWGLAVKVAPGTYDYREQGEAAKEDVRYLGWLASSPGSVLTDYNQRREFLTTAGKLAGHAAGWVFNRPEWDVIGFGMAGATNVPGAVARGSRTAKAMRGLAAPLSREAPVVRGAEGAARAEAAGAQVVHEVDDLGRTVRAEGTITGPHPRRGKGYRPEPVGGRSPGDHRGHLVPEGGVDDPAAVNIRANIIAESPRSNLGPKKVFDNMASRLAAENPNSVVKTLHEPLYRGEETRPFAVSHWIEQDGRVVFGLTIPNK